MDGPLASERIVDALAGQCPDTAPAPFDRLSEKVRTRARALRRRLGISAGQRSGHERYLSHIFPDLSVAEVEDRIRRLSAATGRFGGARAASTARNLFALWACAATPPACPLELPTRFERALGRDN